MKQNLTGLFATAVLLATLSLPVSAGEGPTAVPGKHSGCMDRSACLWLAAQGDAGPEPPVAPHAPRPGGRHLEQFRMLKLMELLELSKDQEVEFLVAFQDMRETHRELKEQRDSILQILADGIESENLDDAAIYHMADEIQQLKRRHIQVIDDLLARVKNILSAEQYGKMILFQERFEHQLLEKLREFRGRGGHGGARGM